MNHSLTIAAMAALTTLLAAAPAQASGWDRGVEHPISAAQLGLRDHPSPVRLARAAAGGSPPASGSAPCVSAANRSPGAGCACARPWVACASSGSDIAASVADDTVSSVSGTVVPIEGELRGERRIGAERARRIARLAAKGTVGPAELVAYAGEPAKPRPPRRAWSRSPWPTRAAAMRRRRCAS